MQKPNEPLFTAPGKISGKWAFYFESVLGIPIDIFEDWVNRKYGNNR